VSDRPALRKIAVHLAVLLAYLGVAVATTWPLAARSATHFVGESWDTLVHYWNCWWVKQALVSGQSPFYTPYLFHPQGLSLVYHNFAWLNVVEWLVLSPVVGGLAAYNLSLLINLSLCGWAAYLLARDLTGDGLAAFLAGLIYQCWPFRLSQLGHPNLISTQWIPLFLLFLLRAVRRGRWRDGLLAGVFLALIGYTRWQQLIPAAIMGAVVLACTLVGRWSTWRRWVPVLLLAGGVAALALTPPAVLLLNQQRVAPADLTVEEEEAVKQTDLLAFLTPGGSHPLLGSLTQPAYDRYYANRGGGRPFAAYVGVVALALALVGVWKARQSALPWLATGLVLFLLALGPVLRVAGQLYPAVPMPYRLAARLPLVQLLRFPERFNMFLALPVAMLAAYGLTAVLGWTRQRGMWATAAAACLLGAVVLFEYLAIPVTLERHPVSSFFVGMADEPGDFAVLNLPMGPQRSKWYMFTQTFHRRPILQGKTARFPEGAHAYLDGQRWLRVLRQYNEMDPGLSDVSRQLGLLAEDNVRYIVLHKTQVAADRLAHWQRYLLADPRFEDDQIVVYATEPEAGRDFALADELAPGVGVIRAVPSTDCVNPGHVLGVDVGWGAASAPGRNLQVELALVSSRGETAQAERFSLSNTWPTGEWTTDTVAWGYYTLHTNTSLAPGSYDVTLAVLDEETGKPQGQPRVVGEVMLSSSACPLDLPPDVVGVDASFGEDMRLLGYELRQDGRWLTLTLHWRPEQRMETDYKVFVHVFDPATGAPVAQDDAMPHRWAYPTTFWGLGEVVEDAIPISLQGVPAGAYGVAVGVYDPVTTERLPVTDREGLLQPDGRLVLLGETIEVGEQGP
jgi:hypothetical protein